MYSNSFIQAELAVHKKKVAEVRSWLLDHLTCNQVLRLSLGLKISISYKWIVKPNIRINHATFPTNCTFKERKEGRSNPVILGGFFPFQVCYMQVQCCRELSTPQRPCLHLNGDKLIRDWRE